MKRIIIIAFILSGTLLSAQTPCACCDDRFRQFDFWVGNWNVYDTTGQLLGTNEIELIQDSCVLREQWTSALSPFTGTSYNFYNPLLGIWTQAWVDNQGGSLLLQGEYVYGEMRLTSRPSVNREGREVVNRIIWTPYPSGTVRQVWQTKIDGNPWTTVFDGLYKRK